MADESLPWMTEEEAQQIEGAEVKDALPILSEAEAQALDGEKPTSAMDESLALGITGRDLVRGGGTGLGATAGAALGAPLAPFTMGASVPLGAFLGGMTGDLAANTAVDAATEGIDSVDVGYGDLAESAANSGLNMLLPAAGRKLAKSSFAKGFMESPMGGLADRFLQGVDRTEAFLGNQATKLAEGKNKLIQALAPTAKEFDITVRRRTATEAVDEGIEAGLFDDVTEPRELQERIADMIGSKKKPNVIGQSLDTHAKDLSALPGSETSWAEVRKGLDSNFKEFHQRFLNPETNEPINQLGKDVLSVYEKKVSTLKQSIVAPFEEKAAPLRKELADIQKKLATEKQPIYDVSGKSFSKATKRLQQRAEKITEELLPLEQKIANPEVSFETLYNAQKAFDIDASLAFSKAADERDEIAEVSYLLANTARDLVNGKAQVIDPAIGGEFLGLKKQYELLKELEPMVLRAVTSAEKSPLSSMLGPEKTLGVSPIGGLRNIPGVGRAALKPTLTTRPLSKRELFQQGVKQIQQTRALFDTLSPTPFQYNVLDSAGRLATATAAVRASRVEEANAQTFEPVIVTPSMSKLDEAKSSISDYMTLGMLSQQGIGPEQLQSGITPQVLDGARQMVAPEIDSLFQGVNDAVSRYGADSREAMIALSTVTSQFPEAFERPKSGIAGEIHVSGKTVLPLPEQRQVYADKLRSQYRSGKVELSEMAKAMNKLNADGEVVLRIK